MSKINELGAICDAKKYLKIDDLDIVAQKCDIKGFSIKREGSKYLVKYGEVCDLLRAYGHISLYGDEICEMAQNKEIEHLGYLVDTARNAVPTLDTLKKMMIRLASYGYDRLYLYVEDTMQVENEPFYGHLRGRYSFDELRQIDSYAYELGIEVTPCIQTLAHLNCMFKWPEYAGCNDTADILLIDDDRTYYLINNIFSTISSCFRSKHVHIGLDEAYLVGRGRHMDLYGYEEKHVLLKRHIEMVMNIARKYDFSAEIWSDMYFREAFGGGYYSATQGLSDEICEEIPKSVGLVYWDYWNRDEQVIENMFKNHIKTKNEITFAGGAWKWSGWNPSNRMALVVGRKMLDACKRHKIGSVILTAWSDDGAEASIFTTLPSIVLYSAYAYSQKTDDQSISDIVKRQTGLTLEEYCVADLDFFAGSGREETYLFGTLPKILLYNDPLSGFYDGILKNYQLTEKIKYCREELKRISGLCTSEEKAAFDIMISLCNVLEIKWDLGLRVRDAYQRDDREALYQISDVDIPELLNRLARFKPLFYRGWMAENKTNGFGTHDLRLGGVSDRIRTVRMLINSYLNNEIKSISELDEKLLDFDENSTLDMLLWTTWKRIHTIYVM